MERRKSSIQNEYDLFGMRKGTDDIDLGKSFRPRCGSIIPFDLDVDKDGFKRPKEFKSEDIQEQAPRRDTPMGTMSPNFRLISPIILPEDRNIRTHLPLNSASAALSNPLMSPVATYSPDLVKYPTAAFPFQAEYGVAAPNDSIRKNSGIRTYELLGEFLPPVYMQSPFIQANSALTQTRQSPFMPRYMQQDEFCLDEEVSRGLLKMQGERKIGYLTVSERKEKIKHYLEKRKRRIWKKKVSYDCRKKVADKRLRIKGRFVTKEQACEILGLTPEDLANNKLLKALITNNDNCSIVTSAKDMKIRNIQTLLSSSIKGKVKDKIEKESKRKGNSEDNANLSDNREIRVEILTQNTKEQTVEIKIETIAKSKDSDITNIQALNQKRDERLPKLQEQVFQFKKLKPEELTSNHTKYHKE